ncbi:SpoIIE family protein phosphatase [Streptacidiphilus monticola]|uniref:SpoIIE family protein phosphatase n=1 Tax=Streptacidiphilus monticola TaxID=2161674 RepID=A0ABW1FVB1_9ACTN
MSLEERPENVLGFMDEAQTRALLATLEAAGEHRGLAAEYRTMRQMLDGASLGVAFLGTDLRYRYVNEALARINGVPAAQHVGRRIADVVPGIDVDAAEAELRAVLRDGKPRNHTVEGTTQADGAAELRWWHNAYHRVHGADGQVLGVAGMVLEITEDRRIREALDRARTRLALLDEAATRIGTTLDVQQTCKELTRLLVPRLADIAVVDILDPDCPPGRQIVNGSPRLVRLAMSTTPALVKAGRWFGAPGARLNPQPTAATARCLAQQRPVVSNFPDDEQLAADAPEAGRVGRYRRMGIHSALCVPLTARHDTVGVVVLVRAGDSPSFSSEDVDLVTELARRAAASVNHAQRFAQEHEAALVLQRALLAGQVVSHPRIECAGRYLPAGASAEVGGDWYDSLRLPDGRALLVVGDVMGHGLDAAASMGEFRMLLRALALQGWDPARILDEAQRTAHALRLDRVTTCLVAELDPAAGTATFASAGHLPPLLATPNAPARLLELPVDPPLGIGPHRYRSRTEQLPPGSVLLLYTDGLVERRGEDIDKSLSRLPALGLDPAAPLEHLLDAALAQLSIVDGEDDVALLAARIS